MEAQDLVNQMRVQDFVDALMEERPDLIEYDEIFAFVLRVLRNIRTQPDKIGVDEIFADFVAEELSKSYQERG